MGAELFHADGQMDMANLTVTFRNFANDPQNYTINNDSLCNNTLLHAANTKIYTALDSDFSAVLN